MNVLATLRRRKALQESLANISWLSADKLFRMLGGIIAGTAVARYLGPGQFGLLNYALALYSLFNVVSSLGLDFLIVREIALHPEQEGELLGTGFMLKAAASLVTTAAAILSARILFPGDRTVTLIVAIVSVASISQALDVTDYFFQANIRSRLSVVPRNIVFVVASVCRILAVILRRPLLDFAWIAGFEILFSELGLALAYLRMRATTPRWHVLWSRATSLLREGWPLMLAAVMYTVYMRTDQVMLGRMASPTASGEYAAATRLSEIWYTLPAIICNSVMPRLLKDKESAPSVYFGRMQQLYNLLVLLSFGLALAMTLVGSTLVRLLYGAQFHLAGNVLTVQIWSSIFVFIGTAGAAQMVHERLGRLELQRCVFGAIVNVALNFWWIPLFGVLGSAYATLCTHAVTSYFADALNRSTRSMFQMKTRALLGAGIFKAKAY